MTRPCRLWHGSVAADALLFRRDVPRRLIDAWMAGATVYEIDGGLLLLLPSPRRVRAQEAAGEIFVRVEGRLTSANLGTKEAAAFPAGSLIRPIGGELVVRPAATAPHSTPVPADCIVDVSGFELRPARPLATVASPRTVTPQRPAETVRGVLGVAESSEAVQMQKAIAEARGDTASEGGWLGRIGRALAGLRKDLAEVPNGPARGGRHDPSRGGQAEPRLRKPSAMLIALQAFFNRFLLASRLASRLGRKQAEYMANLVDMLERRRFDEALLKAIPLNDEVISSLGQITFGVPTGRQSLSLNLYATPSSGTMLTGGGFHERLRALYRLAADQLERDGKIEQAAFVLADLLNLSEQAVSLLERHGKLVLAARLAEARKLDAAIVVRQWLVAGDRGRAASVARRHEAYAGAVRRLTDTHPALANELRLEWATTLASRGAFAAASDVLWPVENERERARSWLDEAILRGGIGGARALAWKTTAAPEEKETTLAAIKTLLAAEDGETMECRRALVRVLETLPPSPAVSSALRMGLRALLRDFAQLGLALSQKEAEELAKRIGDGTLRADLPALPVTARKSWIEGTGTLAYAVGADDVGASEVHDAVMLDNGLLALAHGESGISLLRRDGTVAARLHEPAHQFVLSDHGDRALALAPRNDSYRITKIDFAARTARYWLDVRCGAFADTYDGATWFISTEDEVHAIDTNASRLDSLWYTGAVGRIVGRMVRSRRSLAFLTGDGQAWQYELPSLTLRSRTQWEGEPLSLHAAMLDEGWADASRAGENRVETIVRIIRDGAGRTVGNFEGSAIDLLTTEAWLTVTLGLPDGSGSETVFIDPTTGLSRARVAMKDSVPAIRITETHFHLFDESGRVVVIDLDRGLVVRDLRVT